MNNQDPAKEVREAMQHGWTMESGQGYEQTIQPLYETLTRLTYDDTIKYGEIDQNLDGEVTALLVTDRKVFYARFQTQEVTDDNGQKTGREVVGGYDLKVAARSQIETINISNITTGGRIDFTVNFPGFHFSNPIRYTGRNEDREMQILQEIIRPLA